MSELQNIDLRETSTVNKPVITNRNHFVPVSYLKGFEDAQGALWCYDKKEKKYFSGNAESSGWGKKLYHPAPPEDPNKYEHFFRDKVENPIIEPLKTLRNKIFPPSTEDRIALSRFFGTLLVRGPKYIAHLEKQSNEELRLLSSAWVEHSRNSEDYKKFGLTAEEHEKCLQIILETPALISRDALLCLMIQWGCTVACFLERMSWVLVEHDGEGLITADYFFYVHNPNIFKQPAGLGFRTSNVRIPISNTLMLWMVNTEEQRDMVWDKSNTDLTVLQNKYITLNNLIFCLSERFVYGKSEALLRDITARIENLGESSVDEKEEDGL